MKYLQRRRRWIRAQKFWAWLRAKREQEYLDAASESSSEESEESSSGSEGDVKVLIFEGNPDARWVSPHSEAGRAAAAKAELEDDASGSGSATPVEDPGQMSMSPVQDDDSEDDFAPAKPQANDDSEDDFAPAKPKNGHDDDSEDDFKAAPAPAQPGVAALLGDLDSDDSEDDGDYDDAGSDDIGDSWLLDVAEPFSSVFASTHRRVGLAYDELMARHEDNASNHPERPERITMSYAELGRQGLLERIQRIPPRRASAQELCRVHEARYVEATIQLGRRCDAIVREQNLEIIARLKQWLGEVAMRENSVYLNEYSVDCALLSAAGAVDAVCKVADGTYQNAAALIRPPGHHAECHCMMGFCLYNNVAVAAAAALHHPTKPCKRILVVDWDVHHGNGTQNMFEGDPRVLFCSIHRHDRGNFYPPGDGGAPFKVGVGKGAGFNVNVGWDGGGSGDGDYVYAFDAFLLPLFRLYRPELIIVSAGFDSARGDPLGGCDLTPKGYARLLHKLIDLEPSRGVALCLEGGYNCISVSRSYAACVGALLGAERPDDDVPEASLRAKRAVAETARHVAPHWPKLHKAEKRCRKAYMRAFKAHLALAAAQPTPQGGEGMDLEPPGFGWSMPAFAASIPLDGGGV